MHRRQRTIAAIVGEFDLIARLAAALGDPGPDVMVPIGDDAAVLAPDLIVSTDLLVEDVHVRRATIRAGGHRLEGARRGGVRSRRHGSRAGRRA